MANEAGTLVVPKNLTRKKKTSVTTTNIVTTNVNFSIVPCESEANYYTIIKPKKVPKVPNSRPKDMHYKKWMLLRFVEDGLLPGYNSGNGISDPYGLNHKYYEMLHGWISERRQRPSAAFDTYYIHKSKPTKCRSIPDVRRYIFGGFDKLKVEVDQETNEVREIMVGIVEKRSRKRKEERSDSKRESAVKKQKSTNCCDTNDVKVLLAGAKNNLNWSWHRTSRDLRIRQIVGGLVGDSGGTSNGGLGAGLGYDEDHVSTVGIIRKRSQRRKRKYSFSKRDFATKKHNNNNFDKTERKARR